MASCLASMCFLARDLGQPLQSRNATEREPWPWNWADVEHIERYWCPCISAGEVILLSLKANYQRLSVEGLSGILRRAKRETIGGEVVCVLLDAGA